jgi:LmbE family N-acetylglucosaminyl deacetylase
LATSYTDPAGITHRVDVRRHISAKRAAMAAHVSQRGAREGRRPLTLFLMLPLPIYRRVFGHEWFTERGRIPKGRPLDDIFFTLKTLDNSA